MKAEIRDDHYIHIIPETLVEDLAIQRVMQIRNDEEGAKVTDFIPPITIHGYTTKNEE